VVKSGRCGKVKNLAQKNKIASCPDLLKFYKKMFTASPFFGGNQLTIRDKRLSVKTRT